MAEDIPGDARLLTYVELGELLGIEPESAKRRAVRHGWRRVPGNEGRTLVAVPRSALPERPPVPRTMSVLTGFRPGDEITAQSGDVPQDVLRDSPEDVRGDEAGRPGDTKHVVALALADLRAALRAAEQRQAEADERAGRAEARADAAQGLADRRGEELAELRERVGRAEARADAAEELAKRRDEEMAAIRERAGRLEGESETLREQIKAERNRSVSQMREVEAARDVAKAELAAWTAGGPFARAVRAFLNRRSRG